MQISLDTKKLEQLIDGMVDRLEDLRPALRVIGRDAVNAVQRNFDEEGRPDAWEPLKQNSMESKVRNLGGGGHRIKKKDGSYNKFFKKIAGGNKILTDKGTLRNSVTTDVEKTRVDIGPSKLPYARIHQKGFKGKNKKGIEMNMPARPYCVVTADEAEDYRDKLKEYIVRGKLR